MQFCLQNISKEAKTLADERKRGFYIEIPAPPVWERNATCPKWVPPKKASGGVPEIFVLKRKEVGIDQENPEGGVFETVMEIPSEPGAITKMISGKKKKNPAYRDVNDSLEEIQAKLLAKCADKLTDELKHRDKKAPVDMGFVGKVLSMSQDNPQFNVFHHSPRT